MREKIHVVSCREDLTAMGMDSFRITVEGLEETTLALDWSNVTLAPILANEKVSFQPNEMKILSIKPVKIPANAMVLMSHYGVNGMGHLVCIGRSDFKMFTEPRTADKAMFQSRIKASVMPNDLLGQVFIVPGKRV